MQCKFCGAELPAGAYKCDMCGQNIHSKKTAMEGGMFGDALMTAPTEYKSVPVKEPSKLPKIIGISAAALVVVVGIIIALVIFMKPKAPADQLIDSIFKTGGLNSLEFTLKSTDSETGMEEKSTGYYVFDSKEKEARLFVMDDKKEKIKLYVYTPSGSYVVNQVTKEVYGAKNGNFEGDEYAVYAGDVNFYVLERNQETGQYMYDVITAMRKESWDDFYVAIAKAFGLYNNNNNMEQNTAAVDGIRNAVETIKKDLKDKDKQKDVFNFSSSKESGFTVCKMEPGFTQILTYLFSLGGDMLDEETKQGLQMMVALSGLAGQSKISIDISLSGGRIANGMISVNGTVTSITTQNANKAEIPARADEFYRAYTRNK